MGELRRSLRTALVTKRGLTTLTRTSLATFGVIGGSVQIYDVLVPAATYHPLLMTVLLGLIPLIAGLTRAWPRHILSHNLGKPDVSITITIGDLFEQDTHLVIGYTDTFDTDTADSRIIHPTSVQAQFQHHHYSNTTTLDHALSQSLTPVTSQPAPTKRLGKTQRYPIGTIAVIDTGNRLAFCLAYSTMGDDLVARATINDIWASLSALWDAIYVHAHREPISMAVIGSELAKVDSLDRASLIRLIILSFAARSRTGVITNRLTIVIHPNDADKINMLELAAFLTTV